MAITAQMVKELRETTGVGMSACKNALVEADGNMERAVEILREKGLASAAQKSGRIATEGLVNSLISDDKKIGAVVEINSETDFVSKNSEFRNLVDLVLNQVLKSNSNTVEELLEENVNGDSKKVSELMTEKISVIGENLKIRRFEKYIANENEILVNYIHDGRIAVLLKLKSELNNDEVLKLGKNICMQIASMNPKFLSSNDVPADFIEKEKEILMQQALNEGKPKDVVEKMVVGRLNKQLKEFCLLDQEYVMDGDLTIKTYLEKSSKELGKEISIVSFVRFEVGEGLEKKQENFADEVNKVING